MKSRLFSLPERTQIGLKLIVTHVLTIPVLLIVSYISRSIIVLSITQTCLLILLLAGYWEFLGVRFKWIFCSILECAILMEMIVILIKNVPGSANTVWFFLLMLLQIYLLFLVTRIIMVILKRDREVLEIAFPFKDGKFMITDGGNSKLSRLMNYHYHSKVHKKRRTNLSMLYATDIVKVARHSKFLPPANEDYPVFSQKIYCPMDGTVFKVINDIKDNIPFSGDYPYNTGNTVVIRRDEYFFLLGHLKFGSISVKEGDIVKKDDEIGECGNSGMSERPHLHMQLMKSDTDEYWQGKGVCIQYRNKDLYKNRILQV